MRQHQKMNTIVGRAHLIEMRVFGVWFYRRYTTQEWTPLMHEYERERGIRIGHRRFGMTETVRKYFDGKEPSVQRGAF